MISRIFFSFILVTFELTSCSSSQKSSLDFWWAYDGISGPEYWGLINPAWSLCNKGKRQSPVNIEPDKLLFDPTLQPLQITGDVFNGTIENTGRGIQLQVTAWSEFSLLSRININGGPLSYNYTFDHMLLHYGHDVEAGSEHVIDGQRFPAELQLYFYNSQLYSKFSESQTKPNGIAVLVIMIQQTAQTQDSKPNSYLAGNPKPVLSAQSQFPKSNLAANLKPENSQLLLISKKLKTTEHLGKRFSREITNVSLINLLPDNYSQYMTYEGSLTQPMCTENVIWIIVNKPIYLSPNSLNDMKNHLDAFGDNYRPLQPLLNRCIRTNINSSSNSDNINNDISRTDKPACKPNRIPSYVSQAKRTF